MEPVCSILNSKCRRLSPELIQLNQVHILILCCSFICHVPLDIPNVLSSTQFLKLKFYKSLNKLILSFVLSIPLIFLYWLALIMKSN
jgi:hypothetical protein